MASASHCDDSEVSKAQESFMYSKVKEEESQDDDYESESENSNCSVTSNVNDIFSHHQEPVDDCADDTRMQQPADSVDTTWTDEKHSSYLNSIEAAFVQKMYDKEYCSLDVCGHSSSSSVNLELDCVESHPFCFNKLQHGGDLQYTSSRGPWILAPSVLASPWIQHFKARQAASVNALDTREEGSPKRESQNFPAHGCASSWNSGMSLKRNSGVHFSTSNVVALASFQFASKKHGTFNIPGCKKSLIKCRECQINPHNFFAGQFKKIKYQQMLSHMDMEMEEQFISKQQTSTKCGDVDTKNGVLCLQMQNTNNLSEPSTRVNSDEMDETKSVKESQSMMVGFEMGLTDKSSKGSLPSKKMDQVVPSFEDTSVGGGCGQRVPMVMIDSLIPKSKGDVPSYANHPLSNQHMPRTSEEGGLGTDTADTNTVCTPSGPKTRAWGVQGPRQQPNGKTSLI